MKYMKKMLAVQLILSEPDIICYKRLTFNIDTTK